MKRSQLSWQWCSVELVDGFYGTFKNSMAGNCDRDHESFSLNIQDTDNERLTVLLRDHSERYEELEQCPLGQRAIIRGGAIKQISENLLEILKDQWPAVRKGRHWSWIVTFSITTNILNRIY